MPRFVTRAVSAVLEEREGLQRVELNDGSRAFVLTQLIGDVGVGDRVVVNTTAVDLGLGSGGWHVVHWNLSRNQWSGPSGGDVLKLRYTSLQVDRGADVAESESLDGMPVVVCDLHSQVGTVATAFASARAAAAPGSSRLAYVMTDSASLPLALSDTVATLRADGTLAFTVTCGQAFGGQAEAVNLTSGLLVAADRADALVVGPGPGVVGTRSRFGYSGLEVAAAIDAVDRRGGRAIVCVRWSDADPRAEHRGVSHHTRTALSEAHARALVAVPAGHTIETHHEVVAVDVPELDVTLTTMGRGRKEDSGFFTWAGAAGVLAARLLSEGR